MPTYVSLAAVVGFCSCSPSTSPSGGTCCASRNGWSASPTIPAEDLARSEALLDRAEAELEEILGRRAAARGHGRADRGGAADGGRARRASQTTTSERPALEQITTEREALLPHPRWRRFAARVSQPRVLGLIAAGSRDPRARRHLRLREAPERQRGSRAVAKARGGRAPGRERRGAERDLGPGPGCQGRRRRQGRTTSRSATWAPAARSTTRPS